MRSLCLSVLAASSCLLAAQRTELDVSASQVWTDTGIDLHAGDSVNITAIGSIQLDYEHATGPEGLPRSWGDLTTHYPVVNAGRGALIARFTDSQAARPFWVGHGVQRYVPVSGHLFLGVNEPAGHAGAGSFHVTVEWAHAAAPAVMYNPVFPQQMLDSIPLRATDIEGNFTDRVNVIIVGSLEKLQAAFSDAGWTLADRNKKEAALHALQASLNREAYTAVPLSELDLFGRHQDYGFIQGDPVKVVATRHHFRLWQSPYTLYGLPVWVGAAAHDTGFDKNIKQNGISHKIDPATDGERDYIAEGLQYTGLAVKEEYVRPSYPVTEAHTATGSGFISDGRTLVVYLQP